MKITLRYKGKTQNLELPGSALGQELIMNAILLSGLHHTRIRVVYEEGGKRIPVSEKVPLSSIESTTFFVRDLGPQVSYRGVFLTEYLGPLLIWLIGRLLIWKRSSSYMSIVTVMWIFHYTKRIFESCFVHTFSHATMPLFNLFKNCSYYYIFALLICYQVLANTDENHLSGRQIGAVLLFFVFESLNGYCHLKLRALRPKGSTAHLVPKGFLFDNIICPNYTMEILSWIAFAVVARSLIAWLFPIAGGIQMWNWAKQKKRRLVTDFPDSGVKRRGTITPLSWL
jgi:very-long-chain enoyl-CoA reductase